MCLQDKISSMTQGCDNEVETLKSRLDRLEEHIKINTEKQIGQ